jgi:hypothetical protein
MQLAQGGLGRAEEAALAVRLGNMQRQAVDPAAHQRALAAEQQGWSDAELARDRQRAPLAREQVARQAEAPPRHLVDAAQHRLDVVWGRAEAAALDRRQQVALEHDAASPASLDFARQSHRGHSAATA